MYACISWMLASTRWRNALAILRIEIGRSRDDSQPHLLQHFQRPSSDRAPACPWPSLASCEISAEICVEQNPLPRGGAFQHSVAAGRPRRTDREHLQMILQANPASPDRVGLASL